MSPEISFEFHAEPTTGNEQTWKVTADVTRENGRLWADITSARPAGESEGVYDVSDLEEALADEDDGRTLRDVQQAAIDAYCARFSEAS